MSSDSSSDDGACGALSISLQRLSIGQQKNREERKTNSEQTQFLVKIEVDPKIFHIDLCNLPRHNMTIVNGALRYEHLGENTQEYLDIEDSIEYDQRLCVMSIKKVYNPYLQKAFELKNQFYYENVKPERLYHGTKIAKVDSICTYNFDWRLSGTSRGDRHGKGVNFSSSPYFATFFCDDETEEKVIIIADVLMKHITRGSAGLVLPPGKFDTTEGKNGTVYVKFYDNEFYPRYVINVAK